MCVGYERRLRSDKTCDGKDEAGWAGKGMVLAGEGQHRKNGFLLWNPTKCPPARGGHRDDGTAGWPSSSAGNQRLLMLCPVLGSACLPHTGNRPKDTVWGSQVLWRPHAGCAWPNPVKASVLTIKTLVGGCKDLLTYILCTLRFEDDSCAEQKGQSWMDSGEGQEIWPEVLHQKEKQNLTFQTRLSTPRRRKLCSGNTALKNH